MSKDFAPEEIKRPTRVVDVLIRYEYAGYHPEKEQKSDHLLLQRNRFGRCLVALTHELKRQALSRVKVEDFYKIDNLGVECTPPCGSCRCGKCHLGTKDYNLKEEMELTNNQRLTPYMFLFPHVKDGPNAGNSKPIAGRFKALLHWAIFCAS